MPKGLSEVIYRRRAGNAIVVIGTDCIYLETIVIEHHIIKTNCIWYTDTIMKKLLNFYGKEKLN
jgi:hypothetical protein